MSDWLHHRLLPAAALFASFGTLICCALPALLVSLGLGAALAGLAGAVPQLVFLSEHKLALFAFAGIMLALSGVARYWTRYAPCPVDAAQAQACRRLRRIGGWIYGAALAIYAIGFFFAFIAARLI